MALHITDDTMTLKIDDRVVATARFSKHDAANENGAWIVSTHPARLFTRNQMMTALTWAASMVVLDASRRGQRMPVLAAWSLAAGIATTFLEQTVRAWHTAGHSQQAIARELSIDRHKAPRAHEAERRPARRRKWPDPASARWLVRPMRRGRLRWWT